MVNFNFLIFGETFYSVAFTHAFQALGEQLKLRQQVIATATVFFKRFYAINSLHTIDPLLLAPTAVFLVTIERRGIQYNNIEQNGTQEERKNDDTPFC